VGSPAFSLSNIKFVFVEGDRRGREKERFYSLYADSRNVRFIEAGGCGEVCRKLSVVRELAIEADEQLHVGGVIDADFRSPEMIRARQDSTSTYILGCHEVENFYLHPGVLQVIRDRAGVHDTVNDMVQAASDRFAGTWVLQRTISYVDVDIVPARELNRNAAQSWNEISVDETSFIERLCTSSLLAGSSVERFSGSGRVLWLPLICIGKPARPKIYGNYVWARRLWVLSTKNSG
jgi:hypothetical protein